MSSSSSSLGGGASWVWVEDEEEVVVPGMVVAGGVEVAGVVRDAEIISAQPPPCDPQCFEGPRDLTTLNALDEFALLHALRVRYGRDEIYTYVSDILISVNPFKKVAYSPPRGPHVLDVSAKARAALGEGSSSQAICISGESGAGKTEATKLVLQHLASGLDELILKSNPITEAFGNAKTVRNNNSSRFGKWTELKMQKHAISSASIVVYLLEKSRVSRVADGEKNFHVFYKLGGGGGDDDHKFFFGFPNDRDIDEVNAAMDAMGIEKEEVQAVAKGVLWLGDIEFRGEDVADCDDPVEASRCFGCDPELLKESLVARTFGARSVIRKPLKPAQARAARDAIAKATYSRLFEFLVSRINDAIGGGGGEISTTTTIGVLDIFGFEHFETNSLEQLCINYCNEKLQAFFNDYVFSKELIEYEREGVSLEFVDDRESKTLELLEHKRHGVFAMIDEEVSVPRGNDEALLSKLRHRHREDPGFEVPRFSPITFGIVHYARVVFYDVSGFVDKNRDRLMEVSCDFENSVMRALYDDGDSTTSSKNKTTICGKFRRQLDDLAATLEACQPHFVRCLKPNSLKVPDKFDAKMILGQMRCAGVLEVCRIRREGYPVRLPFPDFLRRYRCCLFRRFESNSASELVEALLEEKKKQYVVGKTKIFLKSSEELDRKRDAALGLRFAKLQAIYRGRASRRRISAIKAALDARDVARVKELVETDDYIMPPSSLLVAARRFLAVQSAAEARDLAALERALEEYEDESARELARVLTLEPKIAARLRAATEDAAELRAAIAEGEKLEERGGRLLLGEAKERLRRLEKRTELAKAVASRDVDAIRNAIYEEEEDSEDSLVEEAKRLLSCFEELEAAIVAATESRELDTLNTALSNPLLDDDDDDDCPLKAVAEKVREEILDEERRLETLREALVLGTDREKLREAVADVEKLRRRKNQKLAEEARERLVVLEKRSELEKAIAARDVEALRSAMYEAAEDSEDRLVVEEGKRLLANLEALEAAIAARDLAELDAALANFLNLRETPVVPQIKVAEKVREEILDEERRLEALREALVGTDREKLREAVANVPFAGTVEVARAEERIRCEEEVERLLSEGKACDEELISKVATPELKERAKRVVADLKKSKLIASLPLKYEDLLAKQKEFPGEARIFAALRGREELLLAGDDVEGVEELRKTLVFGPEEEEAVERSRKARERVAKADHLVDAVESLDPDRIAAARKNCPGCPEKAVALAAKFENDLRESLAALQTDDVSSLEVAIVRASTLGLEVQGAKKRLARLVRLREANRALLRACRKAEWSRDPSELVDLLEEDDASESKEAKEASDLATVLEIERAARDRLEKAVDAVEIEAALAAVGESDLPEAIEARARLRVENTTTKEPALFKAAAGGGGGGKKKEELEAALSSSLDNPNLLLAKMFEAGFYDSDAVFRASKILKSRENAKAAAEACRAARGRKDLEKAAKILEKKLVAGSTDEQEEREVLVEARARIAANNALEKAILEKDESKLREAAAADDPELREKAANLLKEIRDARAAEAALADKIAAAKNDILGGGRLTNVQALRAAKRAISDAIKIDEKNLPRELVREARDVVATIETMTGLGAFPRLRSGEVRLVHQTTPLNRSLCRLDDRLNEVAKTCHRDILGFCGDICMSYPAAMAQDLLRRGLSSEDDDYQIRDEIFLQLAMQVTDNPSGTSAYRAWRLALLCLRTFHPSDDLKPLLEDMARGGADVFVVSDALKPSVDAFVAALLNTDNTPPSGVVPAPDDILAFCFNNKSQERSMKMVRRASVNRKRLHLKEIGDTLNNTAYDALVPLELRDVLQTSTNDDDAAVEAAFDQLDVMQRAAQVKDRFVALVEQARAALETSSGATEPHAMDLEAQLNLVQTTKIPGLEVAQIIAAEELVARVYDQIDLKHALLESNDAPSLKIALRRANQMRDTHLDAVKDAEGRLDALAPPSFFDKLFYGRGKS
ncbi:hypothetical protein CTAYLR_008278 [Chrysophaeum taylorii]|uniref:Myosin heavy chain n=1 Tax=Chrysophaeum taylorii TaxID=2483200 RepID=A0AAD7XK64_9STRA|nr:hypothetical protein CTAYLR_008278 [Chrysophaeum taylorii]